MSHSETTPRIYTSAMMVFYPFLYMLFALMGLFQAYNLILAGRFEAIVFLIAMEALLLSYFICTPYEVEISSEGLILRYYWRRARIVAWSSIWRVVVRYNRGAWCTIRYGEGLWDRAVFCVDYGFWFRSGKADQFVQRIADAAHLTVIGHTLWGRPIYGRASRERNRGV